MTSLDDPQFCGLCGRVLIPTEWQGKLCLTCPRWGNIPFFQSFAHTYHNTGRWAPPKDVLYDKRTGERK